MLLRLFFLEGGSSWEQQLCEGASTLLYLIAGNLFSEKAESTRQTCDCSERCKKIHSFSSGANFKAYPPPPTTSSPFFSSSSKGKSCWQGDETLSHGLLCWNKAFRKLPVGGDGGWGRETGMSPKINYTFVHLRLMLAWPNLTPGWKRSSTYPRLFWTPCQGRWTERGPISYCQTHLTSAIMKPLWALQRNKDPKRSVIGLDVVLAAVCRMGFNFEGGLKWRESVLLVVLNAEWKDTLAKHLVYTMRCVFQT